MLCPDEEEDREAEADPGAPVARRCTRPEAALLTAAPAEDSVTPPVVVHAPLFGEQVVFIPEPLAHELAIAGELLAVTTWGEARAVAARLSGPTVFVDLNDDPDAGPPSAEDLARLATAIDAVAAAVAASDDDAMAAEVTKAVTALDLDGWLSEFDIEHGWLGTVPAVIESVAGLSRRRAYWQPPGPDEVRLAYAAWSGGMEQRELLGKEIARCTEHFECWHDPDAVFDPETDIPGRGDMDFPPDARAYADEWMPDDVLEAFAEEAWSPVSGSWPEFRLADTDAIVARLTEHGFVCREDHDLVARACPDYDVG